MMFDKNIRNDKEDSRYVYEEKDEENVEINHFDEDPKHSYYSGPGKYCANCYCTKTPLWRKDLNGAYVCNACGLYLKFNKRSKPISYELRITNFKRIEKELLEHLVIKTLANMKARVRLENKQRRK